MRGHEGKEMTGKEMTGKDQSAHDPYRPMTKREMRQDHTALFLLMAGLIMLIATVLLNTGIPSSQAFPPPSSS